MEEQLNALYESLKIDTNSKQSQIQKSTLLSLLIYNQLDKNQPQFFRYVKKTLQKLKSNTISKQQYLKIFLNPNIQLTQSNQQQIADMFFIMDKEKTGSIDADTFLKLYRETENYNKLTPEGKIKLQDEIRQFLRKSTVDGSLTPPEFYKIIKYIQE